MDGDERTGLDVLLVEARTTLRVQERTMAGIDEKGLHLVRLNALIIGLVLTGFSVLSPAPAGASIVAPPVILVASGLACLAGSIIAAVLALRAKTLRMGLGAEDLVVAIELSPAPDAVRREAARAHGFAILENARAMNQGVGRIQISLWLTVAGVLLVAGGTMGLLLDNAPRWF